MTDPDPTHDLAAIALAHGRYLRAIAYRMLGSVADAEDAVQEALLRYVSMARSEVELPRAFLARMVTRICLDILKSARKQRESYVGPWLPEPWYEDEDGERAEEVSVALMLVLERLSPLERAAFLLHDVLGLSSEEVARTLEKSPATCRKLSERARAHVAAERPRYTSSEEARMQLSRAFFAAVQTGDSSSIAALLASDAVLYSDGGGKRVTALNPILGRVRIARFFAGLVRRWGAPTLIRFARLSGSAGAVAQNAQRELYTMTIETDGSAVTAVHIVRNPDKLQRIEARFLPRS